MLHLVCRTTGMTFTMSRVVRSSDCSWHIYLTDATILPYGLGGVIRRTTRMMWLRLARLSPTKNRVRLMSRCLRKAVTLCTCRMRSRCYDFSRHSVLCFRFFLKFGLGWIHLLWHDTLYVVNCRYRPLFLNYYLLHLRWNIEVCEARTTPWLFQPSYIP